LDMFWLSSESVRGVVRHLFVCGAIVNFLDSPLNCPG